MKKSHGSPLRYVFNPIVLPILLLIIILPIFLFYYLPQVAVENEKDKIKYEATQLVQDIQIFRNYYNDVVLSKVRANTDLKIDLNHLEFDTTIPLPATVVHDLGFVLTEHKEKYTTKVDFFSNYPFPNRANRELNAKQKEAIDYLEKNPKEVYVTDDIVDGVAVYRVSVPDVFLSQNCVNCHNSRVDSPKIDWELGDTRGVIEITAPILNQLVFTDKQIKLLIYTTLAVAILFVLHYIIVYIRIERQKNNYQKIPNKTIEEKEEELIK